MPKSKKKAPKENLPGIDPYDLPKLLEEGKFTLVYNVKLTHYHSDLSFYAVYPILGKALWTVPLGSWSDWQTDEENKNRIKRAFNSVQEKLDYNSRSYVYDLGRVFFDLSEARDYGDQLKKKKQKEDTIEELKSAKESLVYKQEHIRELQEKLEKLEAEDVAANDVKNG